METRVCKQCGVEKLLSEYESEIKGGKVYHRHRCKICQKEFKNNWLNNNKEKEQKRKRIWTHQNREKINAYKRDKWREDELYKFTESLRTRIGKIFRNKGKSQSDYIQNMIGCTGNEFYNHLLKTYLDNYGERYNETQEVNIDHIIPLSTAKTKDEVYKLFHYTNLQLLKEADNMDKSTSLDWSLKTKK